MVVSSCNNEGEPIKKYKFTDSATKVALGHVEDSIKEDTTGINQDTTNAR